MITELYIEKRADGNYDVVCDGLACIAPPSFYERGVFPPEDHITAAIMMFYERDLEAQYEADQDV